jgi:hypothetical protein
VSSINNFVHSILFELRLFSKVLTMPKNKLSEIDEILAKSQRLAASFTDGSQSTRNLSRGVSCFVDNMTKLTRFYLRADF